MTMADSLCENALALNGAAAKRQLRMLINCSGRDLCASANLDNYLKVFLMAFHQRSCEQSNMPLSTGPWCEE